MANIDEPQSTSHPSKAKNCAECRRLKIKCDRKIPCQNCTKRGCPSLCPDGKLVSKGNRLVLANTEDLHTRIEELSSRIRDLESALSSLQAKHSDETHPLLTPDQLLTGTIRREEEDPNDAPVTSFGSLMIGGDGTAKFFGATSGAEWVIPLEDDNPMHGYACAPISVTGQPDLLKHSTELDLISAAFPNPVDGNALNISSLRALVVSELPPRDKAISLINIYYGRVAWLFDPIPRKRLIEQFFAPCYDNIANPPLSGHGIGLLYAVFGMGMFHNPEQTNYAAIAHQYITLSRASLATECIYVNTSVTAIDAMILHINYFETSDDPGGAAKAWATLGTTMKLAQSLGLHREPSMWGLPSEEVIRRRRTMWELIVLDLWTSLHVGRPPMISRQHFDVEIPLDTPDPSSAEPKFHRGKHYFTQTCVWPVLDVALASAERSSYSAVLKLDKKIRDWKLPKTLQVAHHIPEEDQQTAYIFQRTVIFIVREITLLCLHRSYFAAALLEPPFEPLRNRYSRSVLAAYASACAVLGRIRTLYAREPIIIVRFPLFWTHSFTAAVLLGAIAARAPDCPLAATALVEFDHAVDMFTRAQHGYRPGRLLPVLLSLKSKAQEAVDSYRNGTWTRPTEADPQLFPGLGGSKAILQHTRQQAAVSPSASSDDDNVMTSLGGVQPTLDEYLRSFDHQSGDVNAQAPMAVPSSDAFLQGALTGDWGSLGATEAPLSDLSSSFWGAPFVPEVSQHTQSPAHQVYTPSIGGFSHSPYSDGGVSSGSATSRPAFETTQSLFPPGPQFTAVPNIANANTDPEGSVLWDSFLRDLGINHVPN